MATSRAVRQDHQIEWILLTRGPEGMCLVGPDELPFLIPTRAREVYDVSGAGDTAIATLAAGVAGGLPFREAACLANVAAGVVIGKLGTEGGNPGKPLKSWIPAKTCPRVLKAGSMRE